LYNHFYAQHSIPYLFAFVLHLVKIICFLLWMLIKILFKELWSWRWKTILDILRHEPYLPPPWYWVVWIICVWGPCWPSILVIFSYPKSIYLPPYSILFHLYMPHFSPIFHIQVTKLSFSIFGIFCKNWVLKVNLDCIKNSNNSFMEVICAWHLNEIWAHIRKSWEPWMKKHLLVHSNWAKHACSMLVKLDLLFKNS